MDLLELLDHPVHLEKLVHLDPKEIQVTRDHRYVTTPSSCTLYMCVRVYNYACVYYVFGSAT